MHPNYAALQKGFWKSRINSMDEIIAALTDKAFAAYKKKNFLAARDNFLECIQILEEKNETLQAAEMRNNLSVVLLELKKPEEALAILQGTDLVFADANDKKRQAMALGNIASSQQALGNQAEALSTFELSADIFKEIHEKELRAITLKKISDLQFKTGKQYQALASLDASYNQHQKKTFKEFILKGFLGTIINKLIHKS